MSEKRNAITLRSRGGGRGVGAQTRPFIRYGETPLFYSVRTSCSGETPTVRNVYAIRMHQLRTTQRSAVAVIAGNPLARENPDGSCFLCGTNASLGYGPRKGRYCNTKNPSTARKPRWTVFSVLYENPQYGSCCNSEKIHVSWNLHSPSVHLSVLLSSAHLVS